MIYRPDTLETWSTGEIDRKLRETRFTESVVAIHGWHVGEDSLMYTRFEDWLSVGLEASLVIMQAEPHRQGCRK